MYSHKVDRYCSLFLGNFVAHAGTVRKKAGEPFISTLLAMVVARLSPSSGVLRGLLGIWRHAKFCTSPLIAASKAGALCIVVSGDLNKSDGQYYWPIFSIGQYRQITQYWPIILGIPYNPKFLL